MEMGPFLAYGVMDPAPASANLLRAGSKSNRPHPGRLSGAASVRGEHSVADRATLRLPPRPPAAPTLRGVPVSWQGGGRSFAIAAAAWPSRRLRRPQPAAGWENRRASRENGVDDLGVVDALEVDRPDAEVGVGELALNDVEWDAFQGSS